MPSPSAQLIQASSDLSPSPAPHASRSRRAGLPQRASIAVRGRQGPSRTASRPQIAAATFTRIPSATHDARSVTPEPPTGAALPAGCLPGARRLIRRRLGRGPAARAARRAAVTVTPGFAGARAAAARRHRARHAATGGHDGAAQISCRFARHARRRLGRACSQLETARRAPSKCLNTRTTRAERPGHHHGDRGLFIHVTTFR